MFTSRAIIQFGLAAQIILLLIGSSLLMPTPQPTISPSTNVESSSSTTQSECGAIPQNPRGNCNCRQVNPGSCTSLQDALFAEYSQEGHIDTPYHFFSLKDLYYSLLLDSRGRVPLEGIPLNGSINPESEIERTLTALRCDELIERYNLPTKDTDRCTWTYVCTQNLLHFPSFHVEAQLDPSSTGVCNSVTTHVSKSFFRTQCQHDRCRADWLQCTCESPVIGFRAS